MQMKKLVSFVVAVAMATAFCVPAFAATPGEEAAGKAESVLELTESNWATNKNQACQVMADLTDQVSTQQDITVTQVMNNAGVSFFDMAEVNKDDTITKVEATGEFSGLQVVYRKDTKADNLTINSVSYNDAGVITLDAVQEGAASDYGYAVTIMLPAETNVYYYNVSIRNGQLITVTVPVVAYQDKDGATHKMVTFWAPHFTTYELTPLSLNNNNNEQTVTSDSNSDSNEEETVTTTTTTTVTENPIKATGVSMNMSVFAVVACAAVAACGASVAVKKSHKGE